MLLLLSSNSKEVWIEGFKAKFLESPGEISQEKKVLLAKPGRKLHLIMQKKKQKQGL